MEQTPIPNSLAEIALLIKEVFKVKFDPLGKMADIDFDEMAKQLTPPQIEDLRKFLSSSAEEEDLAVDEEAEDEESATLESEASVVGTNLGAQTESATNPAVALKTPNVSRTTLSRVTGRIKDL